MFGLAIELLRFYLRLLMKIVLLLRISNIGESLVSLSVTLHNFIPHASWPHPNTMRTIERAIDNHVLQRLGMLRQIQHLVFVPLKMAVTPDLNLFHLSNPPNPLYNKHRLHEKHI